MIEAEAGGRFFVITSLDGATHRRPFEPGVFIDAVWVDTDVSAESAEVQAAAVDLWTESVVDQWKADHPWVESPAPAVEPHLNNGGLARFTGAAPVQVLENIRMAGVSRIAKGRWRVSHETAMPSDQYSVFPSVFDGNPRLIRVTARTAAYVEVRVTDLAGAVQDPTEIMVKTERVVND